MLHGVCPDDITGCLAQFEALQVQNMFALKPQRSLSFKATRAAYSHPGSCFSNVQKRSVNSVNSCLSRDRSSLFPQSGFNKLTAVLAENKELVKHLSGLNNCLRTQTQICLSAREKGE